MTRTQDGNLTPWERPQPQLEEFENGWVGCSTCNAQQSVANGLDKFLWWRGHLYEHLKGLRP